MENIKDAGQWTISLRPHSFSEYFGNDKIKKYFYSCAKTGEWPVATLFNGQFGGGKTTAAQIAAMMMVCQHPKENGDPCCECPSCKAILDEKFNRDVIQIDGGQAGKAEVIDTITSFVATPPFKDKEKIVILEEVQELSKAAMDSLLKLLETRRPHIHYIFTSMEDLKASGFKTRCTTFKFGFAKVPEIMYFLKDSMERLGIWNNPEVPQEFKLQGLQLIAQNSSGSYRQALQILHQCWKMRCFDLKEMEELCGLTDVTSFYNVLLMVLDGSKDPLLFDTLLNTDDYIGSFNLSMKVVSDAETYRLFGDVPGNSEFFKKQAAQLSSHPNFHFLRDGMKQLQEQNNSFMKKSVYLIGMCNIIDKCRAMNNFKEASGVSKQNETASSGRRIIVG